MMRLGHSSVVIAVDIVDVIIAIFRRPRTDNV